MSVRIALVGMGRMGVALDALASSRDCTVVARLGRADMARGITRDLLRTAQVAIDCSVPSAVLQNAETCLALGVPLVIGTTGWYDALPTLEASVKQHAGRVLWSPNFAPGVQLMLALAAAAGALFGPTSDFDAHLVETHHAAKLDAPSGTAIAIAQALEQTLGRAIETTSVRTGSVPGTHTLLFDGQFEQISISHETRDRRLFADGALRAAIWLATPRDSGVYTMRDVLDLPPLTGTGS